MSTRELSRRRYSCSGLNSNSLQDNSAEGRFTVKGNGTGAKLFNYIFFSPVRMSIITCRKTDSQKKLSADHIM
jgi:hypothetical protein